MNSVLDPKIVLNVSTPPEKPPDVIVKVPLMTMKEFVNLVTLFVLLVKEPDLVLNVKILN